MVEKEYDELFVEIIPSWMDEGYWHIGQESTVNVPREKDYSDNCRIAATVYYDGRNLNTDRVDWTKLYNLDGAEDFDCN